MSQTQKQVNIDSRLPLIVYRHVFSKQIVRGRSYPLLARVLFNTIWLKKLLAFLSLPPWMASSNMVLSRAIRHAVFEGNVVEVLSQIKFGTCHINAVFGQDDWTALHAAADFGYNDIISALVKKGADANIKDQEGCTCVYVAAYRGHVGTIKILVAAGANVNIKNNYGRTALHSAVTMLHIEAVNELIRSGADLGSQDKDGSTPLHLACYNGCIGIVEILLLGGSDASIQNNAGLTPIQKAHQNRQTVVTTFEALTRHSHTSLARDCIVAGI